MGRTGTREARRESLLREHVEAMWAVACTLTGEETTAVEVVREVVRGTLPPPHQLRQRGLRLEILIAATDAAAARVFSPLDHRLRAGAYAAALGPQAAALRRAFSRRVSWDVQALLWATEVEDIAEADVVRRLGQIHPGREDRRAVLRHAYLDLRRDLETNCSATLRRVFGSAADVEKRATDSHLDSCAVCQAETRWLTDLGSALRSLPPAMPPDVWEQAGQIFRGVQPITALPRPSTTESRRRGPVAVDHYGRKPAFACRDAVVWVPEEHETVGRAVHR